MEHLLVRIHAMQKMVVFHEEIRAWKEEMKVN
jgi:hypothetical protein